MKAFKCDFCGEINEGKVCSYIELTENPTLTTEMGVSTYELCLTCTMKFKKDYPNPTKIKGLFPK